jgi:methylenetetrahydrofolate dehydrogenase (NADP+) / methenyltetrahydrofolate cyclohydrolase
VAPGAALVMDGRRLRDEIVAELRSRIAAAGDPVVRFATVVVADDELSRTHVGYKHDAARAAGMVTTAIDLPAAVGQAQLEEAVRSLAHDDDVHGVFVQLPLPDHLDESAVLELVPPDKDVDGLSQRSLGRLLAGRPGHVPATPLAVLALLARYERPLAGRSAVVIGRSWTVGRPLALLLAREASTVTLADERAPDLAARCRAADLVVSTVGTPGLVTADWVRPGATVVDIGVTRTEDGLVGDVEPDGVAQVAGAVVPNPGGIGPATVACLLRNTLAAAQLLGRFPTTG